MLKYAIFAIVACATVWITGCAMVELGETNNSVEFVCDMFSPLSKGCH